MFTGLVQALGKIQEAKPTPAGKRFAITLAELSDAPITNGDSICVSGVCLTVVEHARGIAHFDVISETLRRTNLGTKKPGDSVNLELSLTPGSFVGGHFVQGHIDALGTVSAISENPADWRITFSVPPEVMPCIVPKGSVAVDGVSMTIASVSPDSFTLAVIPTTLQKTTLATLQVGDQINIETDILARTVVHYLQQITPGKPLPPAPKITLAKLHELGMA